MKSIKYIIGLFCLLLSLKTQAQNVQTNKSAIALNKEVFKIIKKNSLFSD